MKIKALIASCCVLLGCDAPIPKATKFEWYASENGPVGYPTRILAGKFFFHGEAGGLSIPTGATLNQGWGGGGSEYASDSKWPLPDRVEVIYYSFTERQFYKGQFDLPYERILELFRQPYKGDPRTPTYDHISVGVAPGGAVAVWVRGFATTEVFFGQAQPHKVHPGAVTRAQIQDEAEAWAFNDEILISVIGQEAYDRIQLEGVPVGLWSRYRNRYRWAPAYVAGKPPADEKMLTKFFNGESFWSKTRFSEQEQDIPRPLPRWIKVSLNIGGEEIMNIVEFNDLELMAAFEKLGANGERVFIEFDGAIPRTQLKVRVRNDKESIELKKMRLEDW